MSEVTPSPDSPERGEQQPALVLNNVIEQAVESLDLGEDDELDRDPRSGHWDDLADDLYEDTIIVEEAEPMAFESVEAEREATGRGPAPEPETGDPAPAGEPEQRAKTDATSDPQDESPPETAREPETEAKAGAEPEPETEAESKGEAEPEPQPEPKTEAKAEAEPALEPDPAPARELDPEPRLETVQPPIPTPIVAAPALSSPIGGPRQGLIAAGVVALLGAIVYLGPIRGHMQAQDEHIATLNGSLAELQAREAALTEELTALRPLPQEVDRLDVSTSEFERSADARLDSIQTDMEALGIEMADARSRGKTCPDDAVMTGLRRRRLPDGKISLRPVCRTLQVSVAKAGG